MSVEILLLCVMVGVTLLGYMITINSHSPTRLSFSGLIATIMLAGTVWAVVQHVNSGLDKVQRAEFQRLELEKERAEELAESREQSFLESKKKMDIAGKMNKVVSQGMGHASSMINVDLRDFSIELEALIGRANAMRASTAELTKEFESIGSQTEYFPDALRSMKEALDNLSSAANYYRLYFRAEDSSQEEQRERFMRQNARKAYDLFKSSSASLASIE